MKKMCKIFLIIHCVSTLISCGTILDPTIEYCDFSSDTIGYCEDKKNLRLCNRACDEYFNNRSCWNEATCQEDGECRYYLLTGEEDRYSAACFSPDDPTYSETFPERPK